MHNTITSYLQCYKRPDYLVEQIEAIKKQTIPTSKFVIVHNEGGMEIDYASAYFSGKPLDVFYANPNQKFHFRFTIALLASTEYVAFFDDDTIPGEKWFENCIDTIKRHDCVCVTNGRIYTHDKRSPWLCPGWGNPSTKEIEVDFGGHAWFLKTENLRYMWQDKIHNINNGEDIMLSANLKRFGGIPTFVPPHPPTDKSLWGSGDKAVKYGSDEVASWIVNPIHFEERVELIEKYIKSGWKTLK